MNVSVGLKERGGGGGNRYGSWGEVVKDRATQAGGQTLF